jgi:integration host factor subunit beta
MTKTNLIKKLSEQIKIQPRAAKAIVDNIFDAMKESLEKGERIEIRGFGSFVMRQYGGYKGRNPKTGKIADVPPKRLPHFKAGKELKDLLTNKGSRVRQ